jgi:hypothetical protein
MRPRIISAIEPGMALIEIVASAGQMGSLFLPAGPGSLPLPAGAGSLPLPAGAGSLPLPAGRLP